MDTDELKSALSRNILTYRKAFVDIVDRSGACKEVVKTIFYLAAAFPSKKRMLLAAKNLKDYAHMSDATKFIISWLCASPGEFSETKFPSVKIASSFPEIALILYLSGRKVGSNPESILTKPWLASLDLYDEVRNLNKVAYM